MAVPLPRSRLARVAALVAAIGVLASGLFVVLTVTGGGADSPTTAVRRAFQAVTDSDPRAAAMALAPTERALLQARSSELVTELERLGLVTPFDQGHVPGARVTTDALAFTTTSLGPTITAVDVIAGRITLELDPSHPLTGAARDQLDRDFGIAIDGRTYTRDFAQYPLRVVTVDEGGGWYVSLAYSVAEAWRRAQPVVRDPAAPVGEAPGGGTSTTRPEPRFGRPVTNTGAPTAEGAVRRFVQALVEHQLDAAIALVVPEEAHVLADYLPLLQPGAPPGAGSAINNLNVTMSGEGDEQSGRITALEADLIGDVQNQHLSYTGRCYQATYRFGDAPPYVAFERCNDQRAMPTPAPGAAPDSPEAEAAEAEARRQALLAGGTTLVRSNEAPPRDNIFNALAVFGAGVDLPTFRVVLRGDRWFVSPARTIVDSTIDTLRGLAPDQAATLTDRLRRSVAPPGGDALAREARDPDNALFGPRIAAAQPLVARCFTDVLSTVGEFGVAAYSPACLRHLVATGAVAPGAVEGMVLFGECLNATHQGPPAASNPVRRLFLAERATRSCLQGHIDAGEAPPEALDRMSRPEDQACFVPYQGLAMDAPEPDWAAADVRAAACLATRQAHANN